MPCCCAVNCSQRSEKNVRLFLLPQGDINKERRKKWIKNIKRKGCLPKRAYVCEKHFTYDMFENNRADGRRLLRWDAVPTIFSYKNIPKSRKEPEKGIVNESEIVMDAIKMEPEVDPLAIQTSNNTDWKEKKFSSEEFNSLNLQSIKIKEENEDHISGVTSEIKFEESSVPFNLSLVKCEVEEELCDLDTIREVQDMKVEAEEKKVSTGRCKLWLINSRREDLMAKNEAYLYNNIKFCSLHFENTQFMNENKNKLIWNAVPTLFDVSNKPVLLLPAAEKQKLCINSTSVSVIP
ncbi:THAP domain-containing protein 5-like isoform X2 [Periplaneta americana]|uniref:THAP domain-containing protein 5-like isoform X2 n=1 Tax=Periplaneta americana TaxID=6978 RepID=UPI0037E9BC20